jgi:hypothetical protein
VPVPIFSQPRNMPALKGDAAKHFRSRIRENSDDFRAFRILTSSATIRLQAFSTSGNASRRSLKGRNRTCWAFVPPFQGCVFVDSQPGASLAARAASLCRRLICSAPSGQCPSLHVNRRRPRRIRPRTLPPDETESTALGEGLRPRRNRRPKVSRASTVLGEVARPAAVGFNPDSWYCVAHPPCSARWLGQRPPTALRVQYFLRVP